MLPVDRAVTGAEAFEAVTAANIPVARYRSCPDAGSVPQAAAELAYPVALKAGGLLHKSELGGVVLGLTEATDVLSAATEMAERLGDSAWPLLLQEMAPGFEILVGATRHEGLGVVITVGLGGTAAEVHRDFASERAPVNAARAREMLQSLRSWPLLEGYRGDAPSDVDALCEIVERVSEFVLQDATITELDLNPVRVDVKGSGAVVVDARIVRGPQSTGRRNRSHPSGLVRMLNPKHVVVVGVSDDPLKAGSRLFGYMTSHGFPGKVDAVHPEGGLINGHKRYRSLRDVPGSPDLVCVTVPNAAVLEVVKDAALISAGGVIVHSGGFAEVDEAGELLQDQVVQVCAEAGVALMGPNDMGVVVPSRGVTASISAGLIERPLAGSVALVTSSGALGSCVMSRLMDQGIGLSAWAHAGNEAGLSVSDMVAHLAHDDATSAIALLLEGIKDGDNLVDAVRAARARRKPVFAYSMVRTAAATAAALSHTGSMVGSFAARQAVLRAAGVVEVATLRELEDVIALADTSLLPEGNRMLAVTFSGGACSIIADEAADNRIQLPEITSSVAAALERSDPPLGSVSNPLDLGFQMLARDDVFEHTLVELTMNGDYDAVLIQFTTNADPFADRMARRLVNLRDRIKVPLYVSRFGGQHLAPKALERYSRHRVVVLDAPDRAVRAISHLMRANELLDTVDAPC